MTRRLIVALTLVAGVAAMRPSYPLLAQVPGTWTTAFDGRSLTGWDRVGDANWEVADEVIQASTGAGFLVTPIPYADFQLTLDFWVTPDANSGVFIRCSDPKAISTMTGYEVNIFDMRADQTYRTGGIVNVAKPLTVVNTGNKWNSFDITAKGSKFSVVLNGEKMVDNADNADHPRGHIALQYGAGTVKFRNIRIRTL
ncbi:MAG: DUF1080 domain-containing protein [Vicinamibacterales bacterium]